MSGEKEKKERILRFEITGEVNGRNLIAHNRVQLSAEKEVIQQFLFGVLEEVFKDIKKSGVDVDVYCDRQTIN